MREWRGWDPFPPSIPREAKGGIRAHSQRGGFGQTWWARRWIAVLESFHLPGRLQRGRSYARRGQVLSIEIGSGMVSSEVQGSRPEPYHVGIRVKPLSDADWRKVARVVSSQTIYAAKLLAGEMPQDIESTFQAAGLSLFPQRSADLETNCSCPDYSNPCKHIAAVYYLLGEEFDRDPFLLFQLRGKSREEFLGMLGEPAPPSAAIAEILPPEPLPVAAVAFWSGPPVPENLIGDVSVQPARATLLRGLGKFPFWRGRDNLASALDPIYRAAASRAAEAVSEIPLVAAPVIEIGG